MNITILLDTGSSTCFASRRLATRLRLDRRKTDTTITSIGGRTLDSAFKEVTFAIVDSNSIRHTVTALVMPDICGKMQRLELLDGGGDVPSDYGAFDCDVDVLVGVAESLDYIISKRHMGVGRVFELNTVFGKLYAGDMQQAWCQTKRSGLFSNEDLSRQLQQHFEIETIGVRTPIEDDERIATTCEAMRILEEGHTLIDGVFTLPMLWRDQLPPIWNNFHIAYKRLLALEHKQSKKPDDKRVYAEALNKFFDMGVAVVIPDSEINKERAYYIPHRAVYKDSKSTPVRPVFDASSGYKFCDFGKVDKRRKLTPSLNACLLDAVIEYPNAVALLLRFRKHIVAFVADVQKFFLRARVQDNCQDFQRFLWRDSEGKLIHCKLTTVTFGIKTSCFVMMWCKGLLADRNQVEFPEACERIRNDIWVDNLLSGCDTDEEAVKLIRQIYDIMQQGSFRFYQWNCSSKAVHDSLPNDWKDTAPFVTVAQPSDMTGTAANPHTGEREDKETRPDPPASALGLRWNVSKDELYFDGYIEAAKPRKTMTKRELVSAVYRLFDPCGFGSCVLVTGRILVHRANMYTEKWDVKLPDDIVLDYNEWCTNVQSIDKVCLPRCLYRMSKVNVTEEFIACCDASMAAYGCCLFLRVVYSDGTIDSNLMFAKALVAPKKILTIPRLELAAVHVGASMLQYAGQVMRMSKVKKTLFTDSGTCVLWCRGDVMRLKVWVKNRVSYILDRVDKSDIRHIRTDINPADFLSRGVGGEQLKSDMWLKGPDFFRLPRDKWPEEAQLVQVKDADDELLDYHIKKADKAVAFAVGAKQARTDDYYGHANTEDMRDVLNQRYSNYRVIRRNAAIILRVASTLARRAKCKNDDWRDTFLSEAPAYDHMWLHPDEYERADIWLASRIQQIAFVYEFKELTSMDNVHKTSRVRKMLPVLDVKNSLLRVGGRLEGTNIEESRKHQILLPSPMPKEKRRFGKECLVTKIIRMYHERVLHAGADRTLWCLRGVYWMIGGRQGVLNVISNCIGCQKIKRRLAAEVIAPLPDFRVDSAPCWTTVFTDTAGPVYVLVGTKAPKGPDTRKQEKAHIAVFVCARSKLIHLELCQSLSVDDFFLAFRRVCARKGTCSRLYSDCHKTYIRAALELNVIKDLHEEEHLHDGVHFPTDEHKARAAKMGIDWSYAPPKGPHRNSIVERRIGTMKNALRVVLGKKLISEWQLLTLLCDMELVMNDSPLCTLNQDSDDLNVITPALLFYGKHLARMPAADDVSRKTIRDSDMTQQEIMKEWKSRQEKADTFERRFITFYLDQLNQTAVQPWMERSATEFRVGQTVLIRKDKFPRTEWPVARVLGVSRNRMDGRIRTLKLKTASDVRSRPIQQVVPLETDLDDLTRRLSFEGTTD